MKSEEIKKLFAQFEAAAAEIEDIECWSARELQKLSSLQSNNFITTVITMAYQSPQLYNYDTVSYF